MDEAFVVGWRIWIWLKLVKVRIVVRWLDVRAILPEELRMIEGRLPTIRR